MPGSRICPAHLPGALVILLCSLALGAPEARLVAPPAPRLAKLTPFLPEVTAEPGVSRAYIALAPDGRSLYLARYEVFGGDGRVTIEVSHRRNGAWSRPETAPFSGQFRDHQPSVSPDGRYVYFVSQRPVNGTARDDYEPWRVPILRDGFGQPEHLAGLGSPANEYAPAVARSGAIYFSSDREGGLGSGDLYTAEPHGGSFGAPRNLGAPINGPSGEWGSTLDASEGVIVFESSGRARGLSGSGDLYVSRRIGNTWTEPRHLQPPVNSVASDLAPRISWDRRSLIFSTNRDGAVSTFETSLTAALEGLEPTSKPRRRDRPNPRRGS